MTFSGGGGKKIQEDKKTSEGEDSWGRTEEGERGKVVSNGEESEEGARRLKIYSGAR